MTDDNVIFKSIPTMYALEKSGKKQNTLRIVSIDDKRFNILHNETAKTITIINTETGESFTRQISDISFWDGRFIISWNELADFKSALLSDDLTNHLWSKFTCLKVSHDVLNEYMQEAIKKAEEKVRE